MKLKVRLSFNCFNLENEAVKNVPGDEDKQNLESGSGFCLRLFFWLSSFFRCVQVPPDVR